MLIYLNKKNFFSRSAWCNQEKAVTLLSKPMRHECI